MGFFVCFFQSSYECTASVSLFTADTLTASGVEHGKSWRMTLQSCEALRTALSARLFSQRRAHDKVSGLAVIRLSRVELHATACSLSSPSSTAVTAGEYGSFLHSFSGIVSKDSVDNFESLFLTEAMHDQHGFGLSFASCWSPWSTLKNTPFASVSPLSLRGPPRHRPTVVHLRQRWRPLPRGRTREIVPVPAL